jgi:type II secretory pathway pseudopilin PulG
MRRGSDSGFSVIELCVATIIFSIVVVGVLGLFDTAGKFNKSELQASEMQQSLRAVLLEIERNVRMAGVGDLPVSQSVIVADPVTGTSYNNVPSGFGFSDWAGGPVHPVRPGTDVIEIRGVIRSPLFALTSAGCFPCVGATDTVVIPAVSPYGVANNSAAEFQTLQSVLGSGGQHLFVVSSQHPDTSVGGTLHNVGMAGAITIDTVPAQARVVMNFTDSSALKFNGSVPYAGSAAIPLDTNIRGGILDDIVYFIDNTRTSHPALCMGLLKGVNPRTFQFFPISEEIEDLQVAYGVDGLDGTAPEGSVQDLYSPLAGKDEWAANVAGEPALTYASLFAAATGPRLRAILLAVVSKAAQSDVAYKGRPFASGIFPLDSAASPASSQATNRKAIAMRVNLRNFNGGS